MLTSAQVQPVAYMLPDGGEFLCRQCTLEAIGFDEDGEYTDDVAKAEMGLENASDVRVVIQYELDEYIGQNASEYADQEVKWHEDQDAWQAAFDEYPDTEPCGSCGKDLV